MHEVFDLAVVTCGWSIACVDPFMAAWRGRPVDEVTRSSWCMLILFYIGPCIGIPGIAGLFSPELRVELLTNWLPDSPVITPAFAFGWVPPLIIGSGATFIRKRCLSYAILKRPKN